MQMSTPANIPLKFEKIVIWTAIGLQDGSALDAIRSAIGESPYIFDYIDIYGVHETGHLGVVVLSCDSEDYDYKLVQVARPKPTPVQEDSQATVTMDTLNDTMDKLAEVEKLKEKQRDLYTRQQAEKAKLDELAEFMKGGE